MKHCDRRIKCCEKDRSQTFSCLKIKVECKEAMKKQFPLCGLLYLTIGDGYNQPIQQGVLPSKFVAFDY